MAAVTPNTERTTVVDRIEAFRPRPEQLDALVARLDRRRTTTTRPAVALAVIDEDGVRVRVIEGPLPLLLAVGRHPACDLHLRQADASMRHALVVADDDGVRLVDLSSSFGLAGQPVAAAGAWASVRAGDSLIAAALLPPGSSVGDVADLRARWQRLDRPASATPGQRPVRVLSVHEVAKAAAAPKPGLRRRQVIRGDGGVVTVADLAGPLLIGRDTRCDIRVDNGDNNISRVHAALLPVRVRGIRAVVVVDVGSTFGTSILRAGPAGVHEVALGPVGRGELVDDGDLLELAGDVRIRLRLGATLSG